MKKLILTLSLIINHFSYATNQATSDKEIYDLLNTDKQASGTVASTPKVVKPANSSEPLTKSTQVVKVNTPATELSNVKPANLDNIDSMSNDILYKKRQLEAEKLNAEIKKAKMGDQTGSQLPNQMSIKETAQTIVTGVAINSDGRKIAWLQFADGGSLTVNIGSQVGEYFVSKITMSTVTLTKEIGKKAKNITLKRSYVAMDRNNNRVVNNAVFNPSPVITGANVSGGNSPLEIVPPIIKQ